MAVLTKATSRQQADEAQFRLVYLATLPVFVLTTALLRLAPARRRAGDKAGSILGEASAAARTCGSLSLMG